MATCHTQCKGTNYTTMQSSFTRAGTFDELLLETKFGGPLRWNSVQTPLGTSLTRAEVYVEPLLQSELVGPMYRSSEQSLLSQGLRYI